MCKHQVGTILATPGLWGLVYMDRRDTNLVRFTESLDRAREHRAPLHVYLRWSTEALTGELMDIALQSVLSLAYKGQKFMLYLHLDTQSLSLARGNGGSVQSAECHYIFSEQNSPCAR